MGDWGFNYHTGLYGFCNNLEAHTRGDRDDIVAGYVRAAEVDDVLPLKVGGQRSAVGRVVVPVHFHEREDAIVNAVVEVTAEEEVLAALAINAEAVAAGG